ncbi:MAG: ABC transporter substrate-binding protein [Candidatus Rokubacteria bacterium]|nr:ABC transporter substrate-binding protein [Candidatus Rokubacteria bacterium]
MRTAVVVIAAMLAVPPGLPTAVLAAEELKIALVAPLSGRWARQGQLKKMGAEMAIEEINAQGGIKSLGGAKIVLREADAGDSVEKAVSAAQRALTREKISAGIGSWLSSFTLGVTEVAERLQVPWFTLSSRSGRRRSPTRRRSCRRSGPRSRTSSSTAPRTSPTRSRSSRR